MGSFVSQTDAVYILRRLLFVQKKLLLRVVQGVTVSPCGMGFPF